MTEWASGRGGDGWLGFRGWAEGGGDSVELLSAMTGWGDAWISYGYHMDINMDVIWIIWISCGYYIDIIRISNGNSKDIL